MLGAAHFAVSLAALLMSWHIEHAAAGYEEHLAKIKSLPKHHSKPLELNEVKNRGNQVPEVQDATDPTISQASVAESALSAMEDSTKKLSQLYMTIRNIALPQSDTNTQQRLVMLLPGKVLNYYDYFPGKEYDAALENPDHTGTHINIPARVMENMFALTDVVPGIYPLGGAETGESLAETYSNILNWMEIKGFDKKTEEEKKRYLKAVVYLTQNVPDPLNVTVNVTRFSLYRRSQNLYNTKRLEVEDIIATQRENLRAPKYESWFQRNYPLLKGAVEAAYTEWLIFGEKEIVELYKSHIDVQTPGIELEDARMVLRAAGVISMDRSKTIFPVSFVPSNWYRYLLSDVDKVDQANKHSAQSGDQIRLQIGRLNAKKAMLMALMSVNVSNEASRALGNARNGSEMANENLKTAAQKAEEDRQRCLAKRGCPNSQSMSQPINNDCGQFTSKADATSELIDANSQIYSCAESLGSQLNVTAQKVYYKQLIAEIDSNIDDLRKALTMSGISVSQLAKHAADSKEQLDSQWLRFQFDSLKSTQQSDSSSSYSSFSSSISASSVFFSASASYSNSKSEQEFISKMNSASVVVKGELLRVTIQRPWFRPSLFRSDHYQMISEDILVSPGDNLPEKEFVSKAKDRKKYHLPHYASGLLLSRNVEVEFRLQDSSSVYQAIQKSSSFSAGFSVGGFWGRGGASVSGSWGRSSSSFKAESSENGLRITIPGAQIIGYYTQNVPIFPPKP